MMILEQLTGYVIIQTQEHQLVSSSVLLSSWLLTDFVGQLELPSLKTPLLYTQMIVFNQVQRHSGTMAQ